MGVSDAELLDGTPGIESGVAPATLASSRASRPRPWPCHNRQVGSDMRNRGRVRRRGVFVSTHSQRRLDTRATAPARPAVAARTGAG